MGGVGRLLAANVGLVVGINGTLFCFDHVWLENRKINYNNTSACEKKTLEGI